MSQTKNQSKLFFNLSTLQESLGGTVETINGISTLNFNNSNGSGRVRHLTFDKGLVVINIDVMLNSNLIFELSNINFEALHFMYCLEGSCSHTFGDSGIMKKINELQSAITETGSSIESAIFLRPNIKNIVNIICVDKNSYFKLNNNTIQLPKTRLKALLKTLDFDKKHLHIGTYNVKIASYVKELLATNENHRMTEQMHFEGISHLILANHIEQLYIESLRETNDIGLIGSELKKIDALTQLIKTNPQEQHSVTSLCEQSGLSPAKLQQGCKALNDRTVSDFVRHVRLQKAESLLKTSDLNISEIVYSIGFTSRSYFCKIFKNEYGCSPKIYKKRIKQHYNTVVDVT